jgi:hypothetical protein
VTGARIRNLRISLSIFATVTQLVAILSYCLSVLGLNRDRTHTRSLTTLVVTLGGYIVGENDVMVKTATVVMFRQKRMKDGRLDLSPPQLTARRLFGMNTAISELATGSMVWKVSLKRPTIEWHVKKRNLHAKFVLWIYQGTGKLL